MKKILIPSGLIVGILILLWLVCSTRIDAGHEGILVKQYGSDKGVQDVTLVTGRVWYNPFTEDVHEFPVYVQTMDYDSFTVNAKDGSVFEVDPTISFHVDAGKSPHIFKKYRKGLDEITSTTLYNYVRDAYRIQMNKYSTDDLISNRERFEADVQKTLGISLAADGFILDNITSGLVYPEVIVTAINNKNRAIQEAMEASNRLAKDSIDARRKIIIAKAEKESNDLRQQSLSPMLIQQLFIEKWDGHTPLYGSAPTLFQTVK